MREILYTGLSPLEQPVTVSIDFDLPQTFVKRAKAGTNPDPPDPAPTAGVPVVTSANDVIV